MIKVGSNWKEKNNEQRTLRVTEVHGDWCHLVPLKGNELDKTRKLLMEEERLLLDHEEVK